MPVRPNILLADIEGFKTSIESGVKIRKNGVEVKNPTSKSAWKSFELKVASDFDTNRTPLSGMCKSLTNSDTLHPKIYVECKLRGGDKDFVFWDEVEKTKKPLQSRIVGFILLDKVTKEEIWLFYSEDFIRLIKGSIFDLNLVNRFSVNVGHKSVLSLYRQTVDRAEIEEKIPVVAIKKKNKKGYMLGTNPKNLEVLHKIVKK